MSKWQKVLVILISVLVMLNALYGIIRSQYVMGMPFDFINSFENSQINDYVSLALFWISLFLLISSMILFLATLIFPKKEKQILLSSENKFNRLSIQKKAIESLILVKANGKTFFEGTSSKVIVKNRRRKVIGKIYGNLRVESNISEKSQQFLDELNDDMQQILGLESKSIRLKLILCPVKKQSKSKNKIRVM